ncbi:MAG: SWIM zinc finger family protein [Candidatus Lokiarchaeota archaeon]|nr:SWIM zinc finger family protein [Candidatus Lokiarchaeota archaeon]
MDRKKYYMDNRRLKKKDVPPQRKTEYEKQRTKEEVEEIKKNLINYAQTPWGKEWIISNLKIGRPFRMQRGIDYAKDEERIDNISISAGQIFATVQGTAPTPYRVKINFEIIPDEGWDMIVKDLSTKLSYLIILLEGSLPQNIITIFEKNGYSLFPDASNGLDSTCSCPDKAIPCKHIAAIILYLTRVIDYNPFLLLELRGKSKDKILDDLSLSRSKESKNESENGSAVKEFEFKFNVPKISIQELSKQDSDIDQDTIGFNIKKPGKFIETLENLGIPQTVSNKAFMIVFKDIYQKITGKIHEMSLEFKN